MGWKDAWHRNGSLFVVPLRDAIFGLPLLRHTLQTESGYAGKRLKTTRTPTEGRWGEIAWRGTALPCSVSALSHGRLLTLCSC